MISAGSSSMPESARLRNIGETTGGIWIVVLKAFENEEALD